MKLCFYLQRRFAPIGHALAKEMKRRYPATEFCGFVELRSGYKKLLMQTDVVYSKLLLEEDIHAKYKAEKLDLDYLKRLEEEYGIPFLWPHLELDRIIRFGLHIREYPHNTPLSSPMQAATPTPTDRPSFVGSPLVTDLRAPTPSGVQRRPVETDSSAPPAASDSTG
jgi:hypothetical protein